MTVFRTATFAGFFFLAVPFNHAFGHHDNLSASLAMGSQWIIHPYAAALFNAAISGGIVLLMKSVDMASKRQLTLTRADAGSFALAIGFLYAAQQIKKHALKDHWVDQKYQQWSNQLASRICR